MSLHLEKGEDTNLRADKTVIFWEDGKADAGPPYDISAKIGGVWYQADIELRGNKVIARFPFQPERPGTFVL